MELYATNSTIPSSRKCSSGSRSKRFRAGTTRGAASAVGIADGATVSAAGARLVLAVCCGSLVSLCCMQIPSLIVLVVLTLAQPDQVHRSLSLGGALHRSGGNSPPPREFT